MTQQESNQRPYNNNYPHQEDAINLVEYLLVLWKWKWLIIGGTLICFIIAAMISLNVPKRYTISMLVEPAITGEKTNGNYTYMDFMGNVGSKINDGLYNNRIIKQLNKSPLKTSIKFNAAAMTKSPLIKISSQWDEKDIEFGLEASKQLIVPVSDDLKKHIETQKSNYDKAILEKRDAISSLEKQEKKNIDKLVLENQEEISAIEKQIKYIDKQILRMQKKISRSEKQEKNNIDSLRALMLDQIRATSNQIKVKQEIFKIINQRIGELTSEVAKVENNTKKMTEQRDGLLKENPSTERISLLLYSTTIQQNMAYSNRLHDEVYNLRKTEKEVSAEIEELNGNVDRIKSEIEKKIRVGNAETLQAKIDKIREEIEDLELVKKELPSQINKLKANLAILKLEKAETLQAKIDEINEKIDELKAKKEMVRNIKVIKNPAPVPVKSKKKMIFLFSAVVGLFLFTFLAFFVEYIKRNLGKSK